MGEFGGMTGQKPTYENHNALWEERWKAEARAARALEAFKLKDEEIETLQKQIAGFKRQIDVVENSAVQVASDREQRLEKKLNHAEAKVAKLNAQLDANRRTNQKLTDEKLEYQANCRAAQERATHAESRLSELIGQNTILQDQLKEARKPKTGPGPRECQKEELKQARSDLVTALQKVAETENKLAGVKAQRETLSNQLREEREMSKNIQFNQDHHHKTLERFKMDVAAANEATKEKESQLQSQSALISQLQSLHADAQNLLKKQEEQHKVQMEGVKRSQKKLILFCQKLEMKRDEDKKAFKGLEDELVTMREEIEDKQAEMAQAVERRQQAESECLSLRLELQQMLDEAQMSDTKRDVIREQKMLQYRDQEAHLNTIIGQQKAELEEWNAKYGILESELKNQIKYSKTVLSKCEEMAEQDKNMKYRLKQKEDQLSNWRKKAEHNELALRSHMKRAGQLEAELKDSNVRIATAEKSRDRAILNSKSIRSQNHKLSREINSQKEKLEEHEVEIVKAKFRKKGLTESDLDLSLRESFSETSVSTTQNHKAIVMEIKLLRKSLKKLDSELAQTRQENAELCDENADLRQKLPSLKKRIKEAENTLEEKEKELEKMKRNATISKTRIEQLQSKTELQQEEISEYAVMEAVQEKLKNTESRLRNVMKDNATLKQRVEDVTNKLNEESEVDTVTKSEMNRLKKDLERKRGLIEDLQNRIKTKEKQVDDVTERMDNKADDLESKTSQLQQSKRSNDNLRRQINEMKLEKDSLYVELTTLRSRLSKLEATKAEVDLELKKTENQLESDAERFEAEIQNNQERQRQALNLLQSKLEETKVTRNELTQTVRNMLEILLLKLDQKQKEKKAAIIKESDFEIIPESKDQVCGILNISDSEFKSIMNAHESDTPSEGNSSSDWLGSIAEVIAAGPPFSDTITNSFRLKLNDLIAYTA